MRQKVNIDAVRLGVRWDKGFSPSACLRLPPVESFDRNKIRPLTRLSSSVVDGFHVSIVFGRWVQEAEWEMKDPPIIDPVEYLGVVGPDASGFAKVTPRK